MSDRQPSDRNQSTPSFRPRFTLGIVYIVFFFFLFSILQVLPDLVAVFSEMQPGPAQERAAAQLAQEHVSPLTSLLLAVAATSLGSYLQVLPGMRER
jgi:hypothetical protein